MYTFLLLGLFLVPSISLAQVVGPTAEVWPNAIIRYETAPGVAYQHDLTGHGTFLYSHGSGVTGYSTLDLQGPTAATGYIYSRTAPDRTSLDPLEALPYGRRPIDGDVLRPTPYPSR